jgi:hypothetical protein
MRTSLLTMVCLLAALPAVAADPPPCPRTLGELGPAAAPTVDAPLVCTCSLASLSQGEVWGMDVYRDQSAICRAALHAGAVRANGGVVTVYPVRGLGTYIGVPRHGVGSKPFDTWPRSIAFSKPDPGALARLPCPHTGEGMPADEQPFSCWCSPTDVLQGDVWGSGVYSADSVLCRAAVHAGALTLNGGIATLRMEPGLAGYDGSVQNTVKSAQHGPADVSYRFAPRKGAPDCWSSDCGAAFLAQPAATPSTPPGSR